MKNIPEIKVDSSEVEKIVKGISSSVTTKEELTLAVSLIDLTSLGGIDNDTIIKKLCAKAVKYDTAAVCVYPSLVRTAKESLMNSKIRIASVAGAFPSGQSPLKTRLEEVRFAIDEGADEIDMVISRGKFLDGNHNFTFDEVAAFREACKNKTLKVILETGELETLQNIRNASDIALHAGADFIKTSTGKISVNATLPAVCVMLQAIKDFQKKKSKKVGVKPSGGISESNTATKYVRLTEKILGMEWLKPSLFRFGASRLLDNIVLQLEGKQINETKGY